MSCAWSQTYCQGTLKAHLQPLWLKLAPFPHRLLCSAKQQEQALLLVAATRSALEALLPAASSVDADVPGLACGTLKPWLTHPNCLSSAPAVLRQLVGLLERALERWLQVGMCPLPLASTGPASVNDKGSKATLLGKRAPASRRGSHRSLTCLCRTTPPWLQHLRPRHQKFCRTRCSWLPPSRAWRLPAWGTPLCLPCWSAALPRMARWAGVGRKLSRRL